ncbi:MAG: metallophosphoesterase family protein [Nitrososphaerales archaeon]
MTTLFFATDVHGSDICWKKFISAGKFYKADLIVLGGDMTGKAIVPIIQMGGDSYKAVLLEQEFMLHGTDEVDAMAQKITSRGYYPYRTTPDEIAEMQRRPACVDEIFVSEVYKRACQWLEYADAKLAGTGIRCYVAPGNDDMFELDELIRTSKFVQNVEGEKIMVDDYHEMISSGWSNPTPWHTYREAEEPELRKRYDAMLALLQKPNQSIFNFHVPPYGSNLDEAPELTSDLKPKEAGRALVPVGSHAVRDIITKYQPLLGLHGHVHEGKGTSRLGRTLCINPGSMYEQGRLLGALINLDKDKVKNYILTTG